MTGSTRGRAEPTNREHSRFSSAQPTRWEVEQACGRETGAMDARGQQESRKITNLAEQANTNGSMIPAQGGKAAKEKAGKQGGEPTGM